MSSCRRQWVVGHANGIVLEREFDGRCDWTIGNYSPRSCKTRVSHCDNEIVCYLRHGKSLCWSCFMKAVQMNNESWREITVLLRRRSNMLMRVLLDHTCRDTARVILEYCERNTTSSVLQYYKRDTTSSILDDYELPTS